MPEITENDKLLLQVLAETDAIWQPDRRPMFGSRHTAIYEKRRDYHAVGVVLNNLAGAGADSGERQRASRALRELAAEGLVTIHKPKWARAMAIKLTEAGDIRARALSAMPTFALTLLSWLHNQRDSALAMDALGPVYGTEGMQDRQMVWHSELILAGVLDTTDPDQRGALIELEGAHLPAIVRGLMIGCATINGHVWYALTPAGVSAAEANQIQEPANIPEPTDETVDHYLAIWQAARSRMETSPPRISNEIGEMPLPCSPVNPRPGAAEAWAKFWKGADK